MYIFLDESGDLGFNWEYKKTSRYFVITLLIANDFTTFKTAVKKTLRHKINHNQKKRLVHELKGGRTPLSVKRYFYEQVNQDSNWYLHTIILDKRALVNNPLIQDNEQLYNLLSKTVLESIAELKNAHLVHLFVDKRKTQKEIDYFDRDIHSHLIANMPNNTQLNIEHICSEKNAGLQAVDMFCYGIARKYELDDNNWYLLYNHRIRKELIYYPKKNRRPLVRSVSHKSSSQPMEGSPWGTQQDLPVYF